MVLKTFCDKCGSELFDPHKPSSFAQILGSEKQGIWSLCEQCSIKLRDWISAGT